MKASLFIFVLSPLILAVSQPIGNGSSCSSAVNNSRVVQYNLTVAQPFILRCPVQLCSQKPSNVTWCKVTDEDTCRPVTPGPRVFLDQVEQDKENYTVPVLKFASVQIDDSGLYKCWVVDQEAQIVRVIRVVIFDGPRPKPFIKDTNKTWTMYFFIAVKVIIVMLVYAFIYYYLQGGKANRTPFRKTFSKIKFVPASGSARRFGNKHHPDIETPTASLETICDDLDSCEDELTVVLSHNKGTLTDETLQDSKERTQDVCF